MSLLWGWNNQHRNTSTRPCDPMRLTTGGRLVFNDSYSVTLSQDVIFEPPCTVDTDAQPRDPTTILDFHEAFYASTSPQMYAIAVATVLCYVLVIILFITPRTYFIGGRGGFLGRHGLISGSYGSASVVGVGGRPWLQKVAALTGAISLTIATADSFEVAKKQYYSGYMDSQALTDEVVNGLLIRIVRIISGTFLWLAQVQTLIRLFPRHKEKVIIKWVGFALIVLDTLFSILNGFISPQSNFIQRGSIAHAIPALNYLFEFSLSLLYAAWVIFYSISKHRFAFFHQKMRNICLVALLSLAAVMIPVIFFIVDVTKPNVAGWGEYIRWVGAAAASVVVWEWVERIEALEREERKGGILGREVFDGDEMLEMTPSKEAGWPDSGGGGRRDGGGKGGDSGSSWFSGASNSHFRRLFHKRAPFKSQRRKQQRHSDPNNLDEGVLPNDSPTVPANAVTPISREGTTSAASTIYRVRYHSVSSPTPSSPDIPPGEEQEEKGLPSLSSVLSKDTSGTTVYNMPGSAPSRKRGTGWLSAANPFKRRRASPPQEVATAQAEEGNLPNVTRNGSAEPSQGRWNLRRNYDWVTSLLNRDLGNSSTSSRPSDPHILPVTVIPVRSRRAHSASTRPADNVIHSRPRRSNTNERKMTDSPLPVMVIPAQPRSSRTWSVQATDDSRLPTFAGLTETPSNMQSPSVDSPEPAVINHANRTTPQQDGRVRWYGEDDQPLQRQSHSAPPELHNIPSEREGIEAAHQSDTPIPSNDQHSIEEESINDAVTSPSRVSNPRSSPE